MNDAAIKEKTWKEFQESGMLWMANTILQVFGWSIAIDQDENGNIISVCPARIKYRGFTQKTNDRGYIKVSKFMEENAEELLKEAME